MVQLSLRNYLVLIFTSCLLLAVSADTALSSTRVRGSFGINSYGYTDENDEDHLWLLQNMRVSVYRSNNPLSFHFSGSYIGDNQDDFSASGSGRFLKGYLQYGRLVDVNRMKLGRFFLHRGVAVGVIDGVEIERRINSFMKLALFAGLTGPLSREFEFEDPADAFSAGGELRLTRRHLMGFNSTSLSLSYTRQTRNGNAFRHRIGINCFGRINPSMNLYTSIHLRPEGSLLRKAIGRFRYSSIKWNAMVEAGLLSTDVADYSWFSDFAHASYSRVRLTVYRYIVPNSWGGGLDGTYLMTGESGFRIGPVVTTPVGQLGYRLSVGEQAVADGPWVNLHYSPVTGVEAYAFGSMISYEWEAFDIEAEDLITFHTGVKYTPSFRKDFTISGEYQVFQTPQFTSDRRVMGGIVWNFDWRMK